MMATRPAGCSVFLVEDEVMIRMMVADMLEELGHSVAAEAGEIGEAVKLAQSTEFDIAILDVNAARRVSILQTWTYSPQNRQDGSAFALTYILRLRSCKSMDAFLSSRPCLPLCWRHCKWQGPFAPRTLLRFIATTDPSATLSSSADFPVSPVIRPTLLRRFRAGTRRASPVAWHVLVTVLSLPPRRGEQPYRSDLRLPMRPSPSG